MRLFSASRTRITPSGEIAAATGPPRSPGSVPLPGVGRRQQLRLRDGVGQRRIGQPMNLDLVEGVVDAHEPSRGMQHEIVATEG